MERNEMIGNATLFGGTIATSCTAPAAYTTESAMLLVFSALGALSAVLGLTYTVWNGNRNFRLQQEQFELDRRERIAHEASKQQFPTSQLESA
jgi:hypothetical protein